MVKNPEVEILKAGIEAHYKFKQYEKKGYHESNVISERIAYYQALAAFKELYKLIEVLNLKDEYFNIEITGGLENEQ